MIWIYFLLPLAIVCGVVLIFGRKTGMSSHDENVQSELLNEVLNQNGANQQSGHGDHSGGF
ncbi:hypothetical protein ACNRWW_06750 [Metabacillus sp. HB246100]|uniref:hypothetical protein n=1 Tax=Bacillus weihaiensis TaxID=1547283 RepID=UPI002352D523|nr:hypothetical protein [Bacillus weihaiensis]